jgi:hypothetical protein
MILCNLPVVSHVKGLDRITHVTKLLDKMEKLAFEKFLIGYLPGWIKMVHDKKNDWNSFMMEHLDRIQAESESSLPASNKDPNTYVKLVHRKKKWWLPRLRQCISGSSDSFVVEYVELLLEHLETDEYLDEDYFTAMYFKEMIQPFLRRMSSGYPKKSYLGIHLCISLSCHILI